MAGSLCHIYTYCFTSKESKFTEGHNKVLLKSILAAHLEIYTPTIAHSSIATFYIFSSSFVSSSACLLGTTVAGASRIFVFDLLFRSLNIATDNKTFELRIYLLFARRRRIEEKTGISKNVYTL